LRICSGIPELRVALAGAPRPLGFVPTMGALHEGHATLVRRAREECASVVASIFVNPLQFGPNEDLARYPRPVEADERLLRSVGCHLLFRPGVPDLYPEGFSTRVDVGPLGSLYEGAVRPGHFSGVATVVLKLFAAVGPDRAYFGRKDAQQLAVLRRMVRDLNLPVELRPVETVRDADGLALSSRNAYLGAEERARALALPRGLFRARDAWRSGERDLPRILAIARAPELVYDYLEAVREEDFAPPRPGEAPLLVAAVRAGATRLIDNLSLGG